MLTFLKSLFQEASWNFNVIKNKTKTYSKYINKKFTSRITEKKERFIIKICILHQL